MSGDQALQSSEAFGKLERGADGSVLRWHPLIDHMIDVAACFIAWRVVVRSDVQWKGAQGASSHEQDIARLAVLAFLHDVGKANSGFQAKRWWDRIPAYWPVRISAGHGLEDFKLFDVPTAAAAIEPLTAQVCTWGAACDHC
jgi:CRISPR-associated endonuclease/helicase Cas3